MGVHVGIMQYAMTFGMKKTRMVWLSNSEKNEDMFICFDTIHERDGNRQTYTAWRHRPRLHIASRGKIG